MPRVLPAKIDWEQPEDDIPSEADVLKAISERPINENQDLMVEGRFDPVITLVSPRIPNGQTIHDQECGFAHFEDIETSTGAPQKVVPLPLADNVPGISNLTHLDRRDPIFSGSYVHSRSRYRGRKIAAAAAALAGVVFVGRFVVDKMPAVDTPHQVPAVSSSEALKPQAIPPVAASKDLPSTPDALRTVKGSVIELERSKVTESTPSSPTAKDTQSIAKERIPESAASRITKRKVPGSGQVGQNTVTTSPTMSTVVITYGGEKVATRIEPVGSSSTKPSTTARRTGDVTRPRVVKEPRR